MPLSGSQDRGCRTPAMQPPSGLRPWLAMLANVSVGCTPQTTDIFVCRRHVGNVVRTCRRHFVKSANFSAFGVVSVRPIADTHSYMSVGIGTNEVVTHTENLEWLPNLQPLIFCSLSRTRPVLTLSKSKYVQEGGNWRCFRLGDVVDMLLGGRRMQQPTINRSGKSN